MPKFTFMSWNVRMYKGSRPRLEEADRLISKYSPDVLGLIEFKAKRQARELMFDRFPEYDFAVTDSKGGLEMIVGFRRGKFKQVIWTQRFDFNNAPRSLRPGALVSVNYAGQWYSLLYLHTDSGTAKKDYGNRWKAFNKIWKLEEALKQSSATGKPNLIILGDLNTMGKGSTLTGAQEIEQLERKARQNGMYMLTKDTSETWHQWGKGPRGNRRKLKVSELASAMRSDLDHVIASKDLDFVAHGDDAQSAIHVEGWQQLNGSDRVDYLWSLSDHSALFGEVW